ncbi:LOW QUALITY PROTEIN: helicase, partial [Mycobacterium tuberculosis T92]
SSTNAITTVVFFGSNVAMVLRRLLRLCARYSAHPTVIFASATTASPGATAADLIGQPVVEVTEDGSPRGARTVALWEPALRSDVIGEHGAPVRRSAGAEAARVMADLIVEGAQTLTFVRSRRAAELTALGARARLVDIAPELSDTVASYRAGYLAEDRSALHQALAEGQLRGLATTNALELGVDIAGLDAVVLAGFPGTVASFWQQAGRSGRRGQGALVVLIARDDPLDTYLVHHPAALLDKPVERVVIDPVNPHLLGPQLLCAATELPLDDAEVRSWGAVEVAESLVDDGLLRRRNGRYFPAPGVKPHAAVDVRGAIGGQIVIVEAGTGRLLGSVGVGQAPAAAHPGAVYLHQGETYVVDSLDFQDGIAFVHAEDPRLCHVRARGHRHRGHRHRRAVGLRARCFGFGAGDCHQSRRRLPAPPAVRGGAGLRGAGHAGTHLAHNRGHVHNHFGCIGPQRY